MVLLSGLPLVSCSEKIVTVSISGYNKVSKKSSTTIVSKYRNRPMEMRHLSLHEYFHELHKDKTPKHIPHYVGSSTTPRFPFTEAFARSMLIIHKPWTGSTNCSGMSKVEELQEFLATENCPKSLKLACARAEERHKNGAHFREPTAQNEESGGCYGIDEIDQETRDMMEFITTFSKVASNDGSTMNQTLHRGINYDWGRKQYPDRDPEKMDGSWLETKIHEYRMEESSTVQAADLRIPKKLNSDGEEEDFTIEGCNEAQKEVLYIILSKLKEYMEFQGIPGNQGKKFVPLRMTIMGEAGTGKSHLIKTITSIVRRMFEENDAVHITGPTGRIYYGCSKCRNFIILMSKGITAANTTPLHHSLPH